MPKEFNPYDNLNIIAGEMGMPRRNPRYNDAGVGVRNLDMQAEALKKALMFDHMAKRLPLISPGILDMEGNAPIDRIQQFGPVNRNDMDYMRGLHLNDYMKRLEQF